MPSGRRPRPLRLSPDSWRYPALVVARLPKNPPESRELPKAAPALGESKLRLHGGGLIFRARSQGSRMRGEPSPSRTYVYGVLGCVGCAS